MVPGNSFHTAEEALAQFDPGQVSAQCSSGFCTESILSRQSLEFPTWGGKDSALCSWQCSWAGSQGSAPGQPAELSFRQEATRELNTGKQRNTAAQLEPRGAEEIPLKMRLEPCVYRSPTGSAKLFWPVSPQGVSPQLWTQEVLPSRSLELSPTTKKHPEVGAWPSFQSLTSSSAASWTPGVSS